MNWRLLAATFAAVFLAELGDKTQLATLGFAAGSDSFWSVFAGSSLALVTSSFLACLVGGTVARFMPVRWVHLGAGVLFVVLGALLIARNVRGG